MYRVLLVDDEEVVRNGLENTFSWEKLGFRVSAVAENGEEALKLIEKEAPHIVITDIKMPEMDGLQLAREIRQLYPSIHVILLSAYNDFKFAQEAIRYNVKGYLLKPVRDKELEEILVRFKDAIKEYDMPNRDGSVQTGVETQPAQPAYVYLLRDLISGRMPHPDRLKKVLKNLSLNTAEDYFRIAVCNLEHSSGPGAAVQLQKLIIDKSREYWEKFNIPAISYMDYLVLFLNAPKPISRSDVSALLKPFKEYAGNLLEPEQVESSKFLIGVGNLYNDIYLTNQSYGEAIYAYNNKFYINKAEIIFYQDIAKLDYSMNDEMENEIMDSLVEQVLLNNQNVISVKTHELFRLIEQNGVFSAYDVQEKLLEIILAIFIKAKDKGLYISSLNKKDIRKSIKSIDTFCGLKDWFERKLKFISNEIREKNADNSNWIVRKAKDYVNNQFSRKITLEEIAGHLYLNPAYFSVAFKKAAGKHFIDFVTEVRMEKAKELLLKSELRIKEISEKVGYDDYGYFCRVFKKSEAVTPLEFRTKGFTGR